MAEREETPSDPPAIPQTEALRPATLCVHGGPRPAAGQGVVVPLERSVTFVLDETAYALRAAGRLEEARVYSRESHPTQEAVEVRLAALEGAEGTALFASGQAALAALLLAHLPPGRTLLLAEPIYGGTAALVASLAPRQGSAVVRFDPTDVAALADRWPKGAALVLAESIANPTLVVADVSGLAKLARERGARLAIDATFATPIGQRPLKLGADLVWHSATKYLGGHSDLLAGVVASSNDLLAPVRRWRTETGATLGPDAAWLLGRGLGTLDLRLRAQCASATRLAAWLAAHPDVVRVHHPSLVEPTVASRHRTHQLALPGAMLSFELAGGDERAAHFVRSLRLILEAASLGGIESLVSLPARMSHSGLTPEARLAAGIHPGLVRLSVGIEDPQDLQADLAQALTASARCSRGLGPRP